MDLAAARDEGAKDDVRAMVILAAVIGRRCRRISVERALDVVAGQIGSG